MSSAKTAQVQEPHSTHYPLQSSCVMCNVCNVSNQTQNMNVQLFFFFMCFVFVSVWFVQAHTTYIRNSRACVLYSASCALHTIRVLFILVCFSTFAGLAFVWQITDSYLTWMIPYAIYLCCSQYSNYSKYFTAMSIVDTFISRFIRQWRNEMFNRIRLNAER